MEDTLAAQGFQRDGPRRLELPIDASRRASASFVKNDGRQVVQARVFFEDGKGLVDRISVRFAVCQVDSVVDVFMGAVTALCREHEMYAAYGYPESATGDMDVLRKVVVSAFRRSKRVWQQLFCGDTEEPAVTPHEAWAYFRAKHPHAFDREGWYPEEE